MQVRLTRWPLRRWTRWLSPAWSGCSEAQAARGAAVRDDRGQGLAARGAAGAVAAAEDGLSGLGVLAVLQGREERAVGHQLLGADGAGQAGEGRDDAGALAAHQAADQVNAALRLRGRQAVARLGGREPALLQGAEREARLGQALRGERGVDVEAVADDAVAEGTGRQLVAARRGARSGSAGWRTVSLSRPLLT